MSEPPHDDTVLLNAATRDAGAAEQLIERLYDELRRIASKLIDRERPGHTLQPTALVNELYLKLIDQTRVATGSRAHFLAIASRAMRQILVDHARAKATPRRGGDRVRVELDQDIAHSIGHLDDVVVFDDALKKLHAESERVANVVEMRVYGGMEIDDVATTLDVSRRTVLSDWSFARAWLSRELSRQSS